MFARRTAAGLLAAALWTGTCTPGHAQVPPRQPPMPYNKGSTTKLTVNGHLLDVDQVFRFLPVTLPLASIRVTSLYGMRMNPFGGDSTEFHPGVDFGAPIGETVFATAAGIVTLTGASGAYGEMVEVRHALGFRTRYSHLSAIHVRPGQVVDRNTPLGAVGNSGRSTGPHLYYECWSGATRVDPVAFIIKMYELYQRL